MLSNKVICLFSFVFISLNLGAMPYAMELQRQKPLSQKPQMAERSQLGEPFYSQFIPQDSISFYTPIDVSQRPSKPQVFQAPVNFLPDTPVTVRTIPHFSALAPRILSTPGISPVTPVYKKFEPQPFEKKSLSTNPKIEFFKPLADQGMADAQYLLGLEYQKLVTPEDLKEGLKYYQLAADQNYALAYYALGSLYYRGGQVTADYQKACDYFLLFEEKARFVDSWLLDSNVRYLSSLFYHHKELILPAARKGSPCAFNHLSQGKRLKLRLEQAEKGDEDARFFLVLTLLGNIPQESYTNLTSNPKALKDARKALDNYSIEVVLIKNSLISLQKKIDIIMKYQGGQGLAIAEKIQEIQRTLMTLYENECEKLVTVPGFYVTCLDSLFSNDHDGYTIQKDFFDLSNRRNFLNTIRFISLTWDEPQSLSHPQFKVILSNQVKELLNHIQQNVLFLIEHDKSCKKGEEIVKKIASLESQVKKLENNFDDMLLQSENYLNLLFIQSILK